jgi:uncharacterized protein
VRVKIDLKQIENEPLGFDEQLSLSGDRLDETQLDGPLEVQLRGTVRPAAGAFLVDGSFAAAGRLRCSRCLEPVPWRIEESFSVEYRRQLAAPAEAEVALERDELDVAFLTDDELDLDRMALEQVLLTLPMRIVCDERCAGLCPSCGGNRNLESGCRCEAEPDPRWDALRGLTGTDASN